MSIDFSRNADYKALYQEVITAVSKIEETASFLEKQNLIKDTYEIEFLKNKINSFFTALAHAKLLVDKDILTIETINAKLIVCEEKLKFFEKLLTKKFLTKKKSHKIRKVRSSNRDKHDQRD